MQTEPKINYGFPTPKYETFPPVVQIALTHYICNSRCRACPVGRVNRGEVETIQLSEEEIRPDKRVFFAQGNFPLFARIADETAQYPWAILRFHSRGEPLLHPDYVRMIAYAKKAGVRVVTSFTNVICLDPQMAGDILDAGLDVLEMSIDAYSEELYRQLRGTERFQQVVANAEYFIRERNRRGTLTRVIVSAVDQPKFQPEKERFREFWSQRADTVIFRPYHTYGGRLRSFSACRPEEVVPCAQLWTRFSINPWGQANACFNDWADEELVGDLNQPGSSIAGIWRGERFEEIREASLKGRSILKCCGSCLATCSSWNESYQLLLSKLQAAEPNRNLA